LRSAAWAVNPWGALLGRKSSQAVAGEIDPVRVVDEAIKDVIGITGIADQLGHLSTEIWLVMIEESVR